MLCGQTETKHHTYTVLRPPRSSPAPKTVYIKEHEELILKQMEQVLQMMIQNSTKKIIVKRF